jgi:hypothetical protein
LIERARLYYNNLGFVVVDGFSLSSFSVFVIGFGAALCALLFFAPRERAGKKKQRLIELKAAHFIRLTPASTRLTLGTYARLCHHHRLISFSIFNNKQH